MSYNKYINFYIYFAWILLWASLGSNPNDFYNITKIDINDFGNRSFQIQIINFFRFVAPLICLLINIFFFKKKIFTSKINFLILLLILFQIFQVIGNILGKTSFDHFENHRDYFGRYYWIAVSLSGITTFLISKQYKHFNTANLLFISIFFIFITSVFFSTKILIDFYNFESAAYHLSIDRDSGLFLSHHIPRITGLSRSLLILYFFILFFFTSADNKLIILKYISLILIGSLILLFQSKFSVILLILVNFLYFFSKRQIFLLIVILSLQLSLATLISYSRNLNLENISTSELIVFETNDNERIISMKQTHGNEKKLKHFRTFDLSFNLYERISWFISSGRFILWKNAYNYFLERPFFGYGSMSDRLIDLTKGKSKLTVNNQIFVWNPKDKLPVSNAFIYAALSGGIFFVISLLIFWYKTLQKTIPRFHKLIIKKNIYLSPYEKISLYLLLLFFLRSFIENTYLIFGIDFIFLLHAIEHLNFNDEK